MLFDRPKQPLYIVATRLVHLFLKEYQDLEDIGLYDDPTQDGIIHILADALNYRHDEYPITGAWRMLGKEPWLDMELYVSIIFTSLWYTLITLIDCKFTAT